MQNIRSLFLAFVGIAAFTALLFLTFSLALVVGGILTVLMVARAISLRMKPAPAPVRARANGKREMHVWNDGRGTIIDL
ncbi:MULTISPECIES: hypothetical protein [unclassified Sinorhizobium]|uniref:hypothetical protein n=1 Tax=unclassified Sinorhizobium TaxID=2613772 RepID=UPI0035264FBF